MQTRQPAPAWLGIGAQRSGTTWFTDLLVQHPEMELGVNDKKEQHALYRPGGLADESSYLALFPTDKLRGEWTPFYLRSLFVPPLAARLCAPDAPFLVLLRDPVERFESAMRLWRMRTQRGKGHPFQYALTDGQWGGMYADQLAAWRKAVGPERLMVMTYESVRDDPQGACEQVWARLGLQPVRLVAVDMPSTSSTGQVRWEWPDGFKETLIDLYAPQVERLRDDWGLDVTPWRTFCHVQAGDRPSNPHSR